MVLSMDLVLMFGIGKDKNIVECLNLIKNMDTEYISLKMVIFIKVNIVIAKGMKLGFFMLVSKDKIDKRKKDY